MYENEKQYFRISQKDKIGNKRSATFSKPVAKLQVLDEIFK